jgi:hypothetical protein
MLGESKALGGRYGPKWKGTISYWLHPPRIPKKGNPIRRTGKLAVLSSKIEHPELNSCLFRTMLVGLTTFDA